MAPSCGVVLRRVVTALQIDAATSLRLTPQPLPGDVYPPIPRTVSGGGKRGRKGDDHSLLPSLGQGGGR
jgi:hypothetical protein